MRAFGRWLLERPVRLVELCSGILLLGVATLVWENAASAAFYYFLGALLLFLTLYAYLGPADDVRRRWGRGAGMSEGPSRVRRVIRFVALAVAAGAVGFLVMRFLFPLVLERNISFLVLPILLIATLLLARAIRRGRSGA